MKKSIVVFMVIFCVAISTCSIHALGLSNTDMIKNTDLNVQNDSVVHNYSNATCTSPKTCLVCGITSGSSLGHTYSNACDTSCDRCGATRTVTHQYSNATCTISKTCLVCGITSGSSLGHTYLHACDTSCDRCGAVRTVTHQYNNATCTTPKTCRVCGVTESVKLGHTYTNSCDTSCNRCGVSRTVTHRYTDACDENCNICKKIRTVSHLNQIIVTKASVSKKGKSQTICKRCGKVTSSTVISYVKSITLSETSFTYDGKDKTPAVVVKDSAGKSLTKNTDYTVSYSRGRKDVGTYTVTVKLKGQYTGSKTLKYKINPVKSSKCSFKLSAESFAYNGSVKSPSVIVKFGNKTLKKNTDYTVTYVSGRKNVGRYKVTVKLKGNYSGSKTLYFTINPKAASVNKLTATKGALTVKLNRSLKQSTGYQIQYSTSKSFSTYSTKKVANVNTATVTLSGLKSQKTYYVRVRTYTTVNGKTFYSNWSTAKSMKAK